MKNLLIAGSAMLILSACGAEKTASEKIAEIAQTVETDKNLGTLTKAEFDLNAIIDEASKVIEEANNAKSGITVAIGSSFLTKNAAADGVLTTDTIKGWNEALGQMKVCEARTLYINSDLAYGDNGRGGIPGGATLLFNMQLIAVEGQSETEAYECPEDKILTGPEAYQ